MKKYLCFLLALALIFQLTACGQKSEKPDVTEEAALPQLFPDTEDPAMLIQKGDMCAQSPDPMDHVLADLYYLKALAMDDRQQTVYEKRAALALRMGDEEYSVRILTEAARKIDSPEFQEQVKKAQENWGNKVMEQNLALGHEAFSQGNPEQAAAAFTAVLESCPEHTEALSARAEAYRALGKSEQAAADYESLISLGSGTEEVFGVLTDYYVSQGDMEAAKNTLTAGIEALDSQTLRDRLPALEAAEYTDQELMEYSEKNLYNINNIEQSIEYGAYYEIKRGEPYCEDSENKWYLVTEDGGKTMADIQKVWSSTFASDYSMNAWGYKEFDGKLCSIGPELGGPPLTDRIEIVSVPYRQGTHAMLFGYVYWYVNPMREEGTWAQPLIHLLTYEDGKWKTSGSCGYYEEEGQWRGGRSRFWLDSDISLPNPDGTMSQEPPAPEPTETEPEPTEVPETTAPVPVPDLKEGGEIGLWKEIGTELVDYGVEILNAGLESFCNGEQHQILQSLLRCKACIRCCLDEAFLREIDDEQVREGLSEIALGELELDDWNDALYGDVLNLLQQALTLEPELAVNLLEIMLTRLPRLVLSLLAEHSADEALSAGIPPKFRFLIGVFEASAERYWKFGESVAAYRGVTGEHAEFLIGTCNDFKNQHAECMQLAAQAALADREKEEPDFLESVKHLKQTAQKHKSDLLNALDSHQTFFFKLMHPKLNKALNALREEIETFHTDYEAVYWLLIS